MERIDRIKVAIELSIVLFAIYWSVQNIISIKIVVTILLYFFLMLFLLQYKWRHATWNMVSGQQEHFKSLSNIIGDARKLFIYCTIIIPLISVSISFGYVKFPEWQKAFIVEHFTKPDEIHELKVVRIDVSKFAEYDMKSLKDSLSRNIEERNPYLFLNTESKIKRYDNQFLVSEMLLYLNNYFCSLSFAIFGLLVVLIGLLILADIFGQITISSSNSGNS